MKQPKTLIAIAAFFLSVSVALGAFGSHALSDVLTPERMQTWKTAVSYQFWNALGLMALGIVSKVYAMEFKWPAMLILAGLIIFPGTLYLLCLTGITWLGAITPLGGISFITGWFIFGLKMIRVEEQA